MPTRRRGKEARAAGDRGGRWRSWQHALGVPQLYIHPAILDAYMNGSMEQTGNRRGAEVAVLAILRRRVKPFREKKAA